MANYKSKVTPAFMQDAIAFLRSPAADRYGVTQGERTRRIEEFFEQTAPRIKDRERQYSYSQLAECLRISNMSLSELYTELGYEVPAPIDGYEELVQKLEGLSSDALKKLYFFAIRFRSEFWVQPIVTTGNPTRIFKNFRKRLCPHRTMPQLDEIADKKHPSYTKMLEDRHDGTSIHTEELPDLCAIFHAPLKWLVTFPSDVPVLHKNILIDNILCCYIQCAANQRDYLDEMIARLAQKEA